MKTNTVVRKNKAVTTSAAVAVTHQGGTAHKMTPEQALRRSVMSCLLWESEFYEDGKTIASRIDDLVKLNPPNIVSQIAIEARTVMHLRHVPLFIVACMAKNPLHKSYVAETLYNVIQRADELAEFLAIYWKNGKTPIANSVKRGLAKAFTKFDEYSLQKYNRDGEIKLRDVLFLCHAKPLDKKQASLWKRLINDNLETPITWETQLSASKGENKASVWKTLLNDKSLGGLAFLRNLRNMVEAGVPISKISDYFSIANFDRVLPFQFISAVKHAPSLLGELEDAMFKSTEKLDKLTGKTLLLVDVSGSMDEKLSGKSENTKLDTASALAILAREICEKVAIYTFSSDVKRVPSARGFALAKAIDKNQPHGGTYLGKAIRTVSELETYDRLIVFTDEQSADTVSSVKSQSYMINVASNKNGVSYKKNWLHLDGFSDSVIDYIIQYENEKINDLID